MRSVRVTLARCVLATGMPAAVAARVAGCWHNDGQSTAPEAESVTVAVPSGLRGGLVLLGGLEDEARWALAKNGTAQATLPNFLDFIDARPLRRLRPDAVSILLP